MMPARDTEGHNGKSVRGKSTKKMDIRLPRFTPESELWNTNVGKCCGWLHLARQSSKEEEEPPGTRLAESVLVFVVLDHETTMVQPNYCAKWYWSSGDEGSSPVGTFPLNSVTLSEVNLTNKERKLIQQQRAKKGDDSSFPPLFTTITSADGDTLLLMANMPRQHQLWFETLEQFIAAANRREGVMRLHDLRSAVTQAGTYPTDEAQSPRAAAFHADYGRELFVSMVSASSRARNGWQGSRRQQGFPAQLVGPACSRHVVELPPLPVAELCHHLELKLSQENTLEVVGMGEPVRALHVMRGDWVVGVEGQGVLGDPSAAQAVDPDEFWAQIERAGHSPDQPCSVVLFRRKRHLAPRTDEVHMAVFVEKAHLPTLRFKGYHDRRVRFLDCVIPTGEGFARTDELIAINFVPLDPFVVSSDAATGVEAVVRASGTAAGEMGGCVLNVLGTSTSRQRTRTDAQRQRQSEEALPPRTSRVSRAHTVGSAAEVDPLSQFAFSVTPRGRTRVRTALNFGEFMHMDAELMLDSVNSKFDAEGQLKGGFMLGNDHQNDAVRPRPRVPQRLGCVFGKHDDLTQLLRVRRRIDGALVTVHAEEGARQKGLMVGDVLVQVHSLAFNASDVPVSLFGLTEEQCEEVLCGVPRPHMLTVWRLAFTSKEVLDGHMVSTLGYKSLHLALTPRVIRGLHFIQPSQHDLGRLQIGALNPLAIEQGFLSGDDVVGVDFEPLDASATPDSLRARLEGASVLNLMRWKVTPLAMTVAGTRRIPHFSSSESFRRRSEASEISTVTL